MKQNKAKIIGLTGGIATGKSTVSNILTKRGYKVIDVDKISRQIVSIGEIAYKDILNYFGIDVLNEDKTINRTYLGEKIFSDEKLREKLNSITHPQIIKKIKQEIKQYSLEEVVFLDIPLLIETLDKLIEEEINLDQIWIVYCNEKIQIERLMNRNNLGYEDAMKRVKSQIPIEEKKEFADTIIDNTKDIKNLTINVEKALQQIS